MNYRSVADLNAVIVRSLAKLPRDFDVVVGIPRSGLVAAGLVALYRNRPLAELRGFLQGQLVGGGARLESLGASPLDLKTARVLAVDDSVQTGREVERTRQLLSQAGLNGKVKFFCVFADPNSVSKVDFYGEVCPMPRVFEWNLMHHPHLEYSCVDIDGVLCRDPTDEENDDGDRYEQFLATVEPLLIPSVSIGWLVTCRLEKYRKLTEAWLARHGVRYKELVMMQYPDKAARVAAGSHGSFKAGVYCRSGAILFIESSLGQAREIAGTTGLDVFCFETREMIRPEGRRAI